MLYVRELIIAFIALEKENIVFSSTLEDIYIYSWGSEVYKLKVLGRRSVQEVQGESSQPSQPFPDKVVGTAMEVVVQILEEVNTKVASNEVKDLLDQAKNGKWW